jgi:hypothetical protein
MADDGQMPMDPGGATQSLDFGQGTQFDAERKELESMGSPGGGAQQPQPGQPPQGGPPPAQGAQQQPSTPTLTPSDVQPGGPIFQNTQLVPNRPWQKEMAIWANHPAAGPWMGAIANRLKKAQDNRPGSQNGGR